MTPAIQRQLDMADDKQIEKAKKWAKALRQHLQLPRCSIPALSKRCNASQLQLGLASRDGALTKELHSQICHLYPSMKRRSVPIFITMGKPFGCAPDSFRPPVETKEQTRRNQFAQAVREFRSRNKLSQSQLAQQAKIIQSTISLIERGMFPLDGVPVTAVLRRWPELQQYVPEPISGQEPVAQPTPAPASAPPHPQDQSSEITPMTDLQTKIQLLEQQLELQKLARSLRYLSAGVQKLADRNEYVKRSDINDLTVQIGDQINVHLTALS